MEENQNVTKKENVFTKLGGAVKSIVKDWNKPSGENVVPNKEIAAFSFGGIGFKTLTAFGQYIQLAVSCLLLGSVYGIDATHFAILFVISTVIGIAKTPLVSWIMDNTNTRFGKLRPYILFAGIPTVIGIIGLCFWVPIDGSLTARMVAIGVFYNIFLIGQQILLSSYAGLSQVITQNSGERNKILTISEFIANLGPSLLQLLFPTLAALIYGNEAAEEGRVALTYIKSYRLLFPIFAIISLALGLLVLFFVKERAVVVKKEEEKKEEVKFAEGLKLVSKNYDFWAVTISRFFKGIKDWVVALMSWIFVYQFIGIDGYLGIATTVVTFGATIGMFLSPFIMKKFGNGKSAFGAFMLSAIATFAMIFTFKIHVIFFIIFMFVFYIAMGPQYILQTSITADALDEIQLQSGKRVEGFAQNFQAMFETLGGVASMGISLPLYAHYGLEGEEIDAVLKVADIREPVILWTIVAATAAAFISAIPFLFCKMTNKRHEEIIAELKAREAATTVEEMRGDPAIQNHFCLGSKNPVRLFSFQQTNQLK